MNNRTRELMAICLAYYGGGVTGSWLALTWHGFTEFPFREVGSVLWPLLIAAMMFGLGE